MGLRGWLISLVLLATAAIIAAGAGMVTQNYHRTLDAADQINLSAANGLANNVAHIVQTGDVVLTQMASAVEREGIEVFRGAYGTWRLKEVIKPLREIGFAMVFDAAGHPVNTSEGFPPSPDFHTDDREYFSRHHAGENFLIGAPIVSRLTGRPIVPITRAVRSETGQLQAIVLVAIEAAYLERLFDEVRHADDDAISILRLDGTIIARSPNIIPGGRYPNSAVLRAALTTDTGTIAAVSVVDGVKRLFGYRKLDNYPLVVTASRSYVTALIPWWKYISLVTAIFGGALILLFAVSFVTMRAISLEEDAQMELAASHRFSEAVLDSISAHLAVLDRNGVIMQTNRAWREFAVRHRLQGDPACIGVNYLEVCRCANGDDEELAQSTAEGLAAVMAGEKERFEIHYPCHAPDTRRWFNLKASRVRGSDNLVVSHEDITEHKLAEEVVLKLANTDSLTGVANRRHFLDAAEREFARARRHELPLAVLMMDADRFKQVNDQYGHDVGDIALCRLVELTREVLRETDLLGRLGGEEFAILLPHSDGGGARALAERIRESIAAWLIETDRGMLRCTVSIGVGTRHPETPSFARMLKEADQALYRAKAGGRNRVEANFAASPSAPE